MAKIGISSSVNSSRTKLLGLLPRSVLERLSASPRPHMMTRIDLVRQCLCQWCDEMWFEVEQEVKKILKEAEAE